MDIKTDLRFICDEITSILRYAESKHSIFIAFNGIAIFGGMGVLRSLLADGVDPHMKYIMIFTLLFLMMAISTCMFSFFPQIHESFAPASQREKSNVLFFEHIKHHSIDSYVDTLCSEYSVNPQDIGPFERCITAQIIANAKLSARKFRLFKLAVTFDLLAITAGLGGFMMKMLLA